MPRPFDPSAILHLPLMANLATSCPDGPRNAPVWFIWEDAALWMLGSTTAKSVLRLQTDPACAVEIVHFANQDGLLLHLGFRGTATIEPADGQRFRRLLAKYLGPDEATWNPWFVDTVAEVDDPDNRWIKLVPQSTFTNNVSYFRTGPDLAWSGGPIPGQTR
ncbi:MAG: pyridoxamine 5'-phosphate oxidase family protein [Paracoccaceae bacterium]